MADSGNRVFGLDLLRALAILFVVYGHGYNMFTSNISPTLYLIPDLDGVSMFFVLSGFLIGRILLRTVAKHDFDGRMLIQFWIRRWFRTLPNYFAVLIFLVIAFNALDRPQSESLLRYFFFAQNLAWPQPVFFVESWSLSIEEWFYLCIPIPLYLSTKIPNVDKRTLMLFWISTVIVLVTLFRIYRVQHFGYSTIGDWDEGLRKQVVTRMDSLMFGVLGAYLSLYEPALWRSAARAAFIVGVALLLVDKALSTAQNIAYLNYYALTVSAVATLLLLPALSSWRTSPGKVARAVTLISMISYSMYLLHLGVVQGLILPLVARGVAPLCSLCTQSDVLRYVTYWVVTLACSYLLFRYFERPTTMLRERWQPRSKAAVTPFAVPPSAN